MLQKFIDRRALSALTGMLTGPLKSMVFWAAFCLGAVLPGVSYANYDYIDLTNPFLRKIPLAIQYFKISERTPDSEKAAVEAAGLLSKTLDFTGYFKIIDPGAFLADSANPAIIRPNIQFERVFMQAVLY